MINHNAAVTFEPNANKNSYAIYRMVPLPMTLNDP